MRIWMTAFVSAMVILFFAATGASAANVAKIGVLDFQRVLDTSDAGKEAQARINKQGKEMEADLKKKGGDIETMRKQLEREQMVISKDARDEKEREIRIKINDFKTLQQRYTKKARSLQLKEMGQIKEAVFEILKTVGKKEGYLLIVERQEGGVLYSPETIDVTDKLIKAYNKEFAEDGKKKK
jgi:outer membrane protein